MGLIKEFDNFNKHGDMFKLIEDIILNNSYAWGWQRDEYNYHVKSKLEELKEKKNE